MEELTTLPPESFPPIRYFYRAEWNFKANPIISISDPKYLTRHIYEARNRDDRNFGGPKIWRNFAKTVRTSQNVKEFSSFC